MFDWLSKNLSHKQNVLFYGSAVYFLAVVIFRFLSRLIFLISKIQNFENRENKMAQKPEYAHTFDC